MPVLLQFDFPYQGPFGPEMSSAMEGLAQDIAAEPGLLFKVWTESRAEARAGGVYLFTDEASARAYQEKHTARLGQFGIGDIRALLFEVNEPLSRITRAPLQP